MKKIFDLKTLIVFILGMLVSGFSIYAYVVDSKDISFTSNKPGFNASNVEGALNTLYDRSGNIYDRIDGMITRASYHGTAGPDGVSTINLSKGNYYVFAATSTANNTTSTSSRDEEDYTLDYKFKFNNVECEMVQGKDNQATATATTHGSYPTMNFKDVILKCTVAESGSIDFQATKTQNNTIVFVSAISAIKIN